VGFKAFKKRSVGRFVGFLFVQDYDVNAVQGMLVHAKRFSHDSLDTVSSGCQAAVFFRYCQSQPPSSQVVFSVQDGKKSIAAALCFAEDPGERFFVEQAGLSGETVASRSFGDPLSFGGGRSRCS